MDALLGKLTNLGYEFFGILLPGALAIILWWWLWLAGGDVVPWATRDALPRMTVPIAMGAVSAATEWSISVSLLLFVAVAYFVGHLLTWVARSGKQYEEVRIRHHLLDTLRFRPPKQDPPYNPKLEPLWKWAGERLLGSQIALSWPLFYPAAKTHLLQQRVPSLITTYQNKYTLHRSLAVASALTAWGTLVIMLLAAVTSFTMTPPRPNWAAVSGVGVVALLGVWGFSSSYLYTWTLWGNYLIIETYVSLRSGGDS